MAEWLGHLMSGWPEWLVIIAIATFLVIMGIIIFYWSLSEGTLPFWNVGTKKMPTIRRKKHDKK